jgi:hypothetical protein
MLTLAFVLGTGAAYARPSAEGQKATPTPNVLNATLSWLTSLVQGNNPFSSLLAASGTKTTIPGGAITTSDGGGFIDPNGGPK